MNTQECLNIITKDSIAIPGLDVDSVLDNMLKNNKTVQDALNPLKESIEDAEGDAKKELEKLLQDEINKWKEQFSSIVKREINNIIACWTQIDSTVTTLVKLIPTIITQVAMPTSTAPPNPARVVIDGQVVKEQLKTILAPVKRTAIDMLTSCTAIEFELPGAILSTIAEIVKINELINKIPG